MKGVHLLNLCVFLVIFGNLIDFSFSECCLSTSLNQCLWCEDCKRSTPCCGHGNCNIFCCNCDGGCRAKSDRWDCGDGRHPTCTGAWWTRGVPKCSTFGSNVCLGKR